MYFEAVWWVQKCFFCCGLGRPIVSRLWGDNMDPEKKRRLDEIFTAFSTVADDAYVFLCNMKEDYSRWAKSAVDYFDLPSEYMHKAGEIWEEHIHPDDREDYRKSINDIFSGKGSGHDLQYRAKARDGNYCVCTCRGIVIRDQDGVPLYFGGAIKNHGNTSFIDTVTGLRSLYGFFEDLRIFLLKKKPGTIIQVGLSNFSAFNEVYGYSFGNRVLQTLARTLKDRYSEIGLVYRLDGTKFAIISDNMDRADITRRYTELRDQLSAGIMVDEHTVTLSINCGCIQVDDFEISDKTIYSCMKYAYYESKNSHMGALSFFNDELNDINRLRMERLNYIRNSVNEGCKGFFLCYQPIVFTDDCKLKGVEALIRWKDDKYGLVPPNDFIPVLEQDALFPTLGRWILYTAMKDGMELIKKYPDIIVSINLSYAQLEKEGFIEEVMSILEETGFPAKNLCLEITERCRLIDTELLKNLIMLLRNHGIKIALDDFGTGYSTLGILREIEVDTVKIDRTFVMNIEKSERDRATVKCISEIADAYGAEVCVEGVETEAMIEQLRTLKVNSLQGYYFSKPITLEDFLGKEF